MTANAIFDFQCSLFLTVIHRKLQDRAMYIHMYIPDLSPEASILRLHMTSFRVIGRHLG